MSCSRSGQSEANCRCSAFTMPVDSAGPIPSSSGTFYLSIIRKIQPAGPYNLLGWSFGGLVAHAIATHLQSMGEEVALLAMLDSYPVQHESLQAAFDDESENLSRQVAINPIMNLLDVLRREGLSTL